MTKRKRAPVEPTVEAPPLRLEYRTPQELNENPRNWRTHPPEQVSALTDTIASVGWAGAILLNERTGMMVDGHARKKVAIERGDKTVPVLIGNWTEEQERLILATFDPIAAMAAKDADAFDAILRELGSQTESIQDLLNDVGCVATEEDVMTEKDQKLKDLIAARKVARERFKDIDDINFWLCLVFQSYEQKQQFLKLLGTVQVLYGMYVDGFALAKQIGFVVEPNTNKPVSTPVDAKLRSLAMSPDEEKS